MHKRLDADTQAYVHTHTHTHTHGRCSSVHNACNSSFAARRQTVGRRSPKQTASRCLHSTHEPLKHAYIGDVLLSHSGATLLYAVDHTETLPDRPPFDHLKMISRLLQNVKSGQGSGKYCRKTAPTTTTTRSSCIIFVSRGEDRCFLFLHISPPTSSGKF